MENKLTDNEIVKALEIHGNEKFDNCERCPYLEGDCCTGFSVYSKPYRDVLDLINRQKTENAELQLKINELQHRLSKLGLYDLQVEVSQKLEKEIKSESIKEFWSKLKEISSHIIDKDLRVINYIEVADGDNLVKEMVGTDK